MLATQKYLLNAKTPASGPGFDEAKRYFYSRGIKWSYDTQTTTTAPATATAPAQATRRVIMTANTKNNKLFLDHYAQECNGLILEAGTWKVLCYPPAPLCYNIDTPKCNNYLFQGLYHIYESADGTSVNFYYYRNQWIISTAKGYHMNNAKWGANTYEETIREILEKMGLTWESFTDALDINYSYTFGFKHPEFHPFRENSSEPLYQMWFIQSTNLNPLDSYYLWQSDHNPCEKIPSQRVFSQCVASLHELYKIAIDAFNSYISTGKVFYGFILRSANPIETGIYSNLYIESSLIRHIRRFWYDHNLIKMCAINNYEKKDAIPLYHFLGKDYNIFRMLFPHYENKFETYNKFIGAVIDVLLGVGEDVGEEKYQIVAKKVQSNVKNIIAIDSDLDNKKRLLREYLTNQNLMYILYPVLYATNL